MKYLSRSCDVGLAAAVIRAVNSPAFGISRRISSVPQAISLLGFSNVATLVTALVLRHLAGGSPTVSLERFWDTAEKVALINSVLARRLGGIAPDAAYSYGLFHDCGIALLMQRFPEYRNVLVDANMHLDTPFTEYEDQMLGTNHATVGYFLTRSWQMEETLSQAVLRHHDLRVFATDSDSDAAEPLVQRMVALGHLAEHLHHEMQRAAPDPEWIKFGPLCLTELGLDDHDLLDLVEDAPQMVG